ncbi:hypothetical protein E1189_05340 [Sansalvadorimonas verongulae]|nr:hypothetical protein [Sansalvadorimonas verongulae]
MSLEIFIGLRTRAAGGQANTPCDDKEIELAMGRALEIIGGMNNLKMALGIYTCLRTRASGGQESAPVMTRISS